LLTATALLAALLATLASGLLLLLTGLLLASLLTALLAALLAALLLLPALLHITHFVVRHGALLRGRNPRHDNFPEPLLVPTAASCAGQQCRNTSEQGSEPVVSSNYRHAGRFHAFSAREMSYRQWPNGISILEQLRRNPAPIADRC
jgi:hypothetical protein